MLRLIIGIFLVLYVLVSLFAKRKKPYFRWASIVIIVWSGALGQLQIEPGIWYLVALGVVSGGAAIFMSMIIMQRSVHSVINRFRTDLQITGFVTNRRGVVWGCLILVGYEELLWRCAIQNVLGNSLLALVVTSVCFALIHVSLEEETLYVLPNMDLLFFSFVLGALYYFCPSFYVVFPAHAVRNLSIKSLAYAKECSDQQQRHRMN